MMTDNLEDCEIVAQLQKSVDGLTHHLPKQRLQNYKFYAKRENIFGIICKNQKKAVSC